MTEPTSPPNSAPEPAAPPAPDLSESAGRLLTTVATAAESTIVSAGAKVESRLTSSISSLADRLEAALRRRGSK